MLNLLMTQSPQMAAMLNGKRFGEDVVKNHSVRQRMAWLHKERTRQPAALSPTADRALRERTA